MKRASAVLAGLLLLATVALSSCAPVAQALADAIDTSDGAVLSYVEHGLAFDPGPALARGVIVRAEGADLALLSVPDGASCTFTSTQLDCRLGDVTTTTTIGLTGTGVAANATWRRAGSSTVYLTFARATP